MNYGAMKSAAGREMRILALVPAFFLFQGMSAEEVLRAVPDHADFGTLDEGDPATVVAKIENTGGATVEITNVQTSCACTEADLGKHTLGPNEETELKVSYITEGRPGPFEKKVIFTTNIPGREKIEIFTIRGEVREAPSAKISVTPRRVVLDDAERRAGRKQAFSIANGGSIPLVITRIRYRDDSAVLFDAAAGESLVIEPGRTRTLELQLDPDGGTEPSQKYILIECNARNAGASGYFLIVQYGKR